jgi:hypothetical protein
MVGGNELRVVVFVDSISAVEEEIVIRQAMEEALGHVELRSCMPINGNIFLLFLQNKYTLVPEEAYLSFDVGHDYHEYLLTFDIF